MVIHLLFLKLFIISLFFITTKSFFTFYGVILGAGVAYIIFSGKSINVRLVVFLMAFSSIFFIRTALFSNYEDIKELVKVLIFISLLAFKPDIDKYFFFFVAIVFSFLNFTLSLFQFLHFDFFSIVESLSSLYNADKHIEASLSYTVPRALGFSSGPSQQAVLSLVLFSYFISVYSYSKTRTILIAFMIFFTFCTVVMTQSKTALIALPISLCIFYISYMKLMSHKVRLLLFSIGVLAGGIALFSLAYIVFFIPELNRVYESGLNVSSFQDRLKNWYAILKPMLDINNGLSYLFGVGRSGLEYYGVNDIPYDSDYVYFLVNFGLIGFFSLCLFIVFNLVKPYFSPLGNGKLMFFSLISSLSIIVSFSLNFYIEPRVYILLGIFLFVRNDFFSLNR